MGLSKMSRRKFLGQASCAALGSTTVLSSIANLMLTNKMIGSSLTPPGDYKAIVCILLSGGADSFNMLVPRGAAEYNEYFTTRSDLALPQGDLLALNPLTDTQNGKLLGLHPSLTGVHDLFENKQKAAMITNVGTLIEPIANATEYFSGTKQRPLGIYSHSDQIQQWQTAAPHNREALGWGGKMADIMQSLNTNQGISMNISLDGRNVWQSGNTVLEYSISNQGNGVQGIEGINQWMSNSGFLNDLRENAMRDMAGEMYANVFKQTLGGLTTQSLDSLEQFQSAIAGVPPFVTEFSDHFLSRDLRMMAKTIGARDTLGMCRQTFFTSYGGWDHHNEVINAQEFQYGVVDNAVSEFYAALEEMGVENDVTLCIISEFARTLTSNGNGSDHAWGGNVFVTGGSVKGKEIYGDYPDLYLNSNPLMISGRGNFIPTTATDLYFAELALWFGVSPNDLHLILPNIANFYNVNGGTPPLGFLL